MSNFFDQFDEQQQAAPAAAPKGNFFDQFDGQKPPEPAPKDQSRIAPEPQYSQGESAYLGALDAAGLGFAPRVAGVIEGVVHGLGRPEGFWNAYTRGRDQAQNVLSGAYDENPASYTAGGIAGGLATGGLAPGVVVKGGTRLGARLLNNTATGALYGGIYGGASTKGDLGSEAAGNAVKGALLGAGGGAAITGAASGAKGLWDAGAKVLNTNPEAWANRKIADMIQPGTAGELASRGATSPDMMLADVLGTPGQRLSRAVINRGSKEGMAFEDALRARQAGQQERIPKALGDALGDPDQFHINMDDLQLKKMRDSDPLYQEFRQTAVPYTKEVEGVLKRLLNDRSVLDGARRLHDLDPQGKKQFFVDMSNAESKIGDKPYMHRVPNAAEYQYIKEALGDAISSAQRSGDKSRARAYVNIKNELVDAVDNALGGEDSVWAKARKAYSDPQELQDALEQGRQVWNNDWERIPRDMLKMSKPEKDAYRLGAVREIVGRMDKNIAQEGDAVGKVWNGSKKKILQALFDNEQAFGDFVKKIENEQMMARTYKKGIGNSTSAQQLADLEGSGHVSLDIRPRRIVEAMLNRTLRKFTGLTEPRADALARALQSKAVTPEMAKRMAASGRSSRLQAAIENQASRVLPVAFQGPPEITIHAGPQNYR